MLYYYCICIKSGYGKRVGADAANKKLTSGPSRGTASRGNEGDNRPLLLDSINSLRYSQKQQRIKQEKHEMPQQQNQHAGRGTSPYLYCYSKQCSKKNTTED